MEALGQDLDWPVDGQWHQGMSRPPGYGPIHLESEGGHDILPYGASSGQSGSMEFAAREDYTDDDMDFPGSMDDDVESCRPESLREYAGKYNELYAGAEVLSPTYSEEEYQEQHIALEDADDKGVVEHADFHYERDLYHHYYEMPDIERGTRTTAHACEDCSAEPNETSGTFEDTFCGDSGDDCSDRFHEDSGDDYSDVIEETCCASADEVHDCQDDDDMDSDQVQVDPWQTKDDYGWESLLIASGGQVDLFHGDDVENEEGPNYVAGGHFQQNDEEEETEGEVGLEFCGQLPQDWSQVPRYYTYHDTEDYWMGSWQHQVRYRLQ
ncbi:hypothetical protein diail_7541 [Diaporthe ilicicola]|nr:hypothetical protein diail_7541 [Diaporthe ilicicola]